MTQNEMLSAMRAVATDEHYPPLQRSLAQQKILAILARQQRDHAIFGVGER